jgi:hypothetical protein
MSSLLAEQTTLRTLLTLFDRSLNKLAWPLVHNKLHTRLEVALREHIREFPVLVVGSVGARIVRIIEPKALDQFLQYHLFALRIAVLFILETLALIEVKQPDEYSSTSKIKNLQLSRCIFCSRENFFGSRTSANPWTASKDKLDIVRIDADFPVQEG